MKDSEVNLGEGGIYRGKTTLETSPGESIKRIHMGSHLMQSREVVAFVLGSCAAAEHNPVLVLQRPLHQCFLL